MAITVIGTSEVTGAAQFDLPYSNAPTDSPPGLINNNNYDYNSSTAVLNINVSSLSPQTGMFYLATVVVTNTSAVLTPPDVNWVQWLANTYTNFSIYTYYKIITNGPGEPSQWTWTVDNTSDIYVLTTNYWGVDLNDPVQYSNSNRQFSSMALTPPMAARSEEFVYYAGFSPPGTMNGFNTNFLDNYHNIWSSSGTFGFIRGASRTGSILEFAAELTASGESAFHGLALKPAQKVGVLTIPKPAGVQEGDFLLLALCIVYGPAVGGLVLDGWTAIRDDGVDPDPDPNSWGDPFYQLLFYKFAGASEPSSYTINIDDRNQPLADTVSYGGNLRVYRGVDPTNPIAGTSFAFDPGNNPNMPAIPSITSAAAGSLLLSIASCNRPDFTIGQDLSMTTVVSPDLVHAFSMGIAEETVGSGATGTKTWRKLFFPQISDVQPNPNVDNATGVIITGQYFTGTTAVTFNNIAASSFVIDNDGQITATAPVTGYGSFTVKVTNAGGDGLFNSYRVTNWRAKADMPVSRFRHDLVELGSGKVLMWGGHSNISDFGVGHTDCYLYNPSNDTWASTGSLPSDRFSGASILLASGKVLVSGGQATSLTNDCRLYDPGTELWTAAGAMNVGRAGHRLTMLSNGKVLASGGDNGATSPKQSELYTPGTNSWGSLASMATDGGSTPMNHVMHIACKLPSDASNRVVILGGLEPSNFDDSSKLGYVQIYTTGTNVWSRGARMPTKVWNCSVAVLSDKRIVVIGGRETLSDSSPFDGIQIYHPDSNTWTTLTSTYPNGVQGALWAVFPSNKILVFGGYSSLNGRRDSYLIDVDADTITNMGDIAPHGFSILNRFYYRDDGGLGGSGSGAILLSNGKVLLVGCLDDGNKTDIFTLP